MLTRSELQDIADETAEAWWRELRRHYPSIQKSPPTMVLNGRLTRTLGRAWVDSNPQIIDLSIKNMLTNINLYRSDIIPHELAHLVAFTVYGDTGHGKAWKQIMVDLGLTPRLSYRLVG